MRWGGRVQDGNDRLFHLYVKTVTQALLEAKYPEIDPNKEQQEREEQKKQKKEIKKEQKKEKKESKKEDREAKERA